MRRRLLPAAAACAALVAVVPALAAKPVSWADAEIRLLGHDPAQFSPDGPVTRGALAELIAAATRSTPAPVARPAARVEMQDLNARLVQALGLTHAAAAFTRSARTAALAPPARFGSEVVARMLGLRTNHPASRDGLERLPADAAPRAEAAYSAARILRFRGDEVARTAAAARSFALPPLGEWQRRILTTAVKLVGYPYVWGGTSERAQVLFGRTLPGGFDCSGFVWRVFKLEPYPGAPTLAATLRGRTTYVLSGEVPASQRIPFAALQPADVVFFGSRGPLSKPAEVGHMGIYLGNGWIVHSSRYGVALERLEGWYRQSFAWARRPLAEARLLPRA